LVEYRKEKVLNPWSWWCFRKSFY